MVSRIGVERPAVEALARAEFLNALASELAELACRFAQRHTAATAWVPGMARRAGSLGSSGTAMVVRVPP
jgi:hypothetical protein